MPRLLDAVGCSDLPRSLRASLVADNKQFRRNRQDRKWRARTPLWLRTQRDGAGYGVEIAGVVTDTGGSSTFGQRVRVDVGREGAVWCLRGIGTSGISLDDPSTDLAFADLRDQLHGRGWRRVAGAPR